MKFSAGFKVGILTIAAIIILVFTVLWVKGRSISTGERIAVHFKDINGLRAGSNVQMMGVRIGQVESLTPVIKPDESYVELKFVLTEPNVIIPTASTISIQQSGIIGEQFLEVTPPPVKEIFIPLKEQIIHSNDKVEMVLSKTKYDVGIIKKTEVIKTSSLPISSSKGIQTEYALKIGYIIDMPGLELPDLIQGEIVKSGETSKLFIKPVKETELEKPETDCPYTIIEPMRVSDFMKLQYRSAEALAITNEKLSAILSEDVMEEIKQTVKNADELTANANKAIDKVAALVDLSKQEIETLSTEVNNLTVKLNKIADDVITITGDKDFSQNLNDTLKNVNQLTINVNNILEDPETDKLLKDIKTTANNISELSTCINSLSKDPAVTSQIKTTLNKLNLALDKLTITLDTVNYITEDERENIKQSLKEIEDTTSNVKKFSEKLNKRFLLFRLMF